MKDRKEKTKKQSLIINLSSQASLAPSPGYADYCGTKAFDDFFTNGLTFELNSNGIDVLSVKPAMVATHMTGRKQADMKEMVITPKQCANGILSNATSGMTFGGHKHEFVGTLTGTLLDLLPARWVSLMGEKVGGQLKEQYKALQEAEKKGK